MKTFGINLQHLKNNQRIHSCKKLKIQSGDIIYVTGASGSGKTVILNELYTGIDKKDKIKLSNISLPKNKLVIDCISGKYFETLKFLSTAGLSDVFDILNSPGNLSRGQKYRFKLACAIAKGKQFVFADEFCSNLDRLTACALTEKLAKFARKHNKNLILASSHDDIIAHLNPDIIIVKYYASPTQVIYKDHRRFQK